MARQASRSRFARLVFWPVPLANKEKPKSKPHPLKNQAQRVRHPRGGWMFKDLKFTLYDLFGYFLPGTILLAAMVIAGWVLYSRDEPMPLFLAIPPRWVLFLLLAYFSGHTAQALASGFHELWKKLPFKKKEDSKFATWTNDVAREKMKPILQKSRT